MVYVLAHAKTIVNKQICCTSAMIMQSTGTMFESCISKYVDT